LVKNEDAEKYYKNYYAGIVFCAHSFFPALKMPLPTLLAKRLGDKILGYFKKPKFGPAIKPSEISKREMDSLQYLGGYVVKKILKKTKNSKNYRSPESQGIIAALECMITSNVQEHRLIKTINRGGLTALNLYSQNLFKIIEEKYRIEVSMDNLRKIDTKKMAAELIKNIDIIYLYNMILDSTSIYLNQETQENLLEKLISLYLRVRSFSTARDIIDKHRKEQKKSKSKGLRKTIKKSTDQEK